MGQETKHSKYRISCAAIGNLKTRLFSMGGGLTYGQWGSIVLCFNTFIYVCRLIKRDRKDRRTEHSLSYNL